MSEPERKTCYFVVFDWMLTDLKLSGYQAFIYAAIHNYSQDPKGCFSGSISYLQDTLGASRQGIIDALAALVKKGLIVKKETIKNGVKFNTYRSIERNCTGSQETVPPVQKLVKGSQETVLGGSQVSVPNNKDIYKKDNKDKPPIVPHVEKQGKKNKQAYPDEFEQAFSLYPKRPGANKPSAFKAWKARINAGITPDELIDGVMRYAHYVGATGVHPQYIKQPSTFFGPDEHYLSDWRPPEKTKQCATSDWLNKLNESRGDYDHDNNIIDINTLAH